MTTIEDLKKMPLGWRFTDENYNLVDEKDFECAIINIEKSSNILWEKYTGSKEFHLMNLPDAFWNRLKELGTIRLDSEEVTEGKKKLDKIGFINPEDEIIFFWGGNNSIVVNWSLFVKYWDDFCYPSDDNNLIVCDEQNIIMVYNEEILKIYKI